jgi:hypothetical protein
MKNIEQDSEGAMLYWRVLDALREDALASMLSDKVQKGIAETVRKQGATLDGNRVRQYTLSPSFYIKLRKDVFPASPIAFLGEKPLAHIVEVIQNSLMPEGW